MAGCKRRESPNGGTAKAGGIPEHFYDEIPAWRFSGCDTEKWSLSGVQTVFFSEVLPHLSAFERQTWKDIFIGAKKENHKIDPESLNKAARDRLEELHAEADNLYSLRIGGTRRIYGHVNDGAFYILWIDFTHGDNETCVCRSYKKHT